MNHNWSRWINASVAKAVKKACDLSQIHLYVEGAPSDTDNELDWIELRINGPKWNGGSKGEWSCDVEINLLILSKPNQVNGYRFLDNIGVAANVLSLPIPVIRLGNRTQDDQVTITCLQLKSRDGEKLKTNQLGRIMATAPMMRATVDGVFYGHFNE